MGGPLFYEFDDAAAVLECYREYIAHAPEQLGCFFGWQIAPDLPFIPKNRVGDLFCVLVTCWNGPHEEAEQVYVIVRGAGTLSAAGDTQTLRVNTGSGVNGLGVLTTDALVAHGLTTIDVGSIGIVDVEPNSRYTGARR